MQRRTVVNEGLRSPLLLLLLQRIMMLRSAFFRRLRVFSQPPQKAAAAGICLQALTALCRPCSIFRKLGTNQLRTSSTHNSISPISGIEQRCNAVFKPIYFLSARTYSSLRSSGVNTDATFTRATHGHTHSTHTQEPLSFPSTVQSSQCSCKPRPGNSALWDDRIKNFEH